MAGEMDAVKVAVMAAWKVASLVAETDSGLSVAMWVWKMEKR